MFQGIEKKDRGGSLMSALLLITIIMLIAATMAGVFTMNMNITQRVSNGTVALSEAEAGISEVLYLITRDENIEAPSSAEESSENPKVTYGFENETIRSTITPGMDSDEAYHVVTFNSSSAYPHSTNNTTLDNDSGSLGRTVPDGMLHIVSTGYCKGQYRSVECIIEKPPFPFGLATSGPIHSTEPLVVKGVSSLDKLVSGDEDRPGHILCNSAEGVRIDQVNPPRPTEISGFIKSAGPAVVAQPAVVRGGIRAHSDASSFADINIENFKNEGEPGVVTLVDNTYPEDQQMDIMYYHPGGGLTYQGSVNMNRALLYVDGDLTINGPVSGEGLIVVNGNATFQAGTTLSGSNKMAVLCSGDMTINGNNNYFTGLVYCEGNLSARNITIVGNTIVNSPDPNKGQALLEDVTVVSNEDTADMTITITSGSGALGQNPVSRYPFPLQVNGGGLGIPPDNDAPGGLLGWPGAGATPDQIAGMLKGPSAFENGSRVPVAEGSATSDNLWSYIVANGGSAEFNPPAFAPDADALINGPGGIKELIASATEAQGMVNDLEAAHAAKSAAENEDPKDMAAIEDANAIIEDLGPKLEAAQEAFDTAADSFAQAFYEYGQSHADADGTFDNGTVPMDITQDHRFNLNEYLPESERVKINFWRVYPRRLN